MIFLVYVAKVGAKIVIILGVDSKDPYTFHTLCTEAEFINLPMGDGSLKIIVRKRLANSTSLCTYLRALMNFCFSILIFARQRYTRPPSAVFLTSTVSP